MSNTPNNIVFIDLTGSTAAYETIGNSEVASVISKITKWIGRVIEAHEGRIIKYLGDGVLAQFSNANSAVEACVFLQQNHTLRIMKWPEALRMGLKIGIAKGDIIYMDNDIFGDAVNLAARLSDMSGSNTIWADESVIAELLRKSNIDPQKQSQRVTVLDEIRYRALGMLRVKGFSNPRSIYQVEWNEEVSTDLITVRSVLSNREQNNSDQFQGRGIALAWMGNSRLLTVRDFPAIIGRMPNSEFIVSDQRVSRQHLKIDWVQGSFVLTDLSTFGTWVRFADDPISNIHLRRNDCIIYSVGEIALGAPFTDFSAPIVAFHVQS